MEDPVLKGEGLESGHIVFFYPPVEILSEGKKQVAAQACLGCTAL